MPTTRRAFGALTAGAALAALAPAGAASAAPRRRLIAHDDFRYGLAQWTAELQDGGTVTACRGVLEIDVPSGATMWFKRRLEGLCVLEYTATPVSEGGANDRVSTPGEPHRVRIVSPGSTVRWWNNGRLVFDYRDAQPYTAGHFAFRTVWSHFRITDFRVWRPTPEHL